MKSSFLRMNSTQKKNNSTIKASSFDKQKRIAGAINTLKKEPVISFLSKVQTYP